MVTKGWNYNAALVWYALCLAQPDSRCLWAWVEDASAAVRACGRAGGRAGGRALVCVRVRVHIGASQCPCSHACTVCTLPSSAM